jgi:hypothetical protein
MQSAVSLQATPANGIVAPVSADADIDCIAPVKLNQSKLEGERVVPLGTPWSAVSSCVMHKPSRGWFP